MLILIFAKCPQKLMWVSDLIWTAMQLHKYQSVTKRQKNWSWKEWQDYFPMFSTCETIAGILHPVLGFPNTWKTLVGSSAEGQQDYLQGIFKGPFQPKLAYNSVHNSCEGSGSEGIQIFWARIVAKAVAL